MGGDRRGGTRIGVPAVRQDNHNRTDSGWKFAEKVVIWRKELFFLPYGTHKLETIGASKLRSGRQLTFEGSPRYPCTGFISGLRRNYRRGGCLSHGRAHCMCVCARVVGSVDLHRPPAVHSDTATSKATWVMFQWRSWLRCVAPRSTDAAYFGIVTSLPGCRTTPVFSVQSLERPHLITKRHWATTHPNWCLLCQEPIGSWTQHHGRKDHALLDQHYNSIIDYAYRSWDPFEVLTRYDKAIGRVASGTQSRRSNRRHFGPYLHATCRGAVRSPRSVPGNNGGRMDHPLAAYHNAVERNDRHRRTELTCMLKFLIDEGVVSDELHAEPFSGPINPTVMMRWRKRLLKRMSERRTHGSLHLTVDDQQDDELPALLDLRDMKSLFAGLYWQGALTLHQLLPQMFLHLFPDAALFNFSNLEDFISCAWNIETAYDLLSLQQLDVSAEKLRRSHNERGGGGAVPANHGRGDHHAAADQDIADTTRDSASAGAAAAQNKLVGEQRNDEELFSWKANFVRSILGQLRWCLPYPGDDRADVLQLHYYDHQAARAGHGPMLVASDDARRVAGPNDVLSDGLPRRLFKSAYVTEVAQPRDVKDRITAPAMCYGRFVANSPRIDPAGGHCVVQHPLGIAVPEVYRAVGEQLLRGLIGELVQCRICEYIVRSEATWLRLGLEKRPHQYRDVNRIAGLVNVWC